MFESESSVEPVVTILVPNHNNTDYLILHVDGKYYGVHSSDMPFDHLMIEHNTNSKWLFMGDEQDEVIEVMESAFELLKSLRHIAALKPNGIVKGRVALGALRRRIQMIIDTQELPKAFSDGHFYSTIPSLEDVKTHLLRNLAGMSRVLPGIDLAEQEQTKLLKYLIETYQKTPSFSNEAVDGKYYYSKNRMFGYYDALTLQSMMLRLKPRRIIEVGSGFSSCVMLDTNRDFLDNKIELTFIDPHPERLQTLISDKDLSHCTLLEQKLGDVDTRLFEQLCENDILFIDSTHVAKINSDVLHYVFGILPSLKNGVFIHIHDIGFPFQYSVNDLMSGRAWNEAYLLRAFLMYNTSFRIVFWNSFMYGTFSELIREEMPYCWNSPGGSIWLQKTGD